VVSGLLLVGLVMVVSFWRYKIVSWLCKKEYKVATLVYGFQLLVYGFGIGNDRRGYEYGVSS
jgi:hypothetical protein